MKKILSVTLITLLLFATAALTVGCGGGSQSEFEQAEQLVNDFFDDMEATIDELFSAITEDMNIDELDELEERMEALLDDAEERFDALEEQLDSLEDLTYEQADNLEELFNTRIIALEDRIEEFEDKIWDLIFK